MLNLLHVYIFTRLVRNKAVKACAGGPFHTHFAQGRQWPGDYCLSMHQIS